VGPDGTPLAGTRADGSPYLSGTEWEFENALAAQKPVFVYRRSEKVLLDPDDIGVRLWTACFTEQTTYPAR
jgi:hypothetical protein